MGLNTKNVKAGSGSGSLLKNILPGEHEVKVTSLELKRFPFMEKDNGYYLVMNVETRPVGGNFEGFLIDSNDESKGRYEGQIGAVKMNKWYYKDGTTKSGVFISRDDEMLKALKRLCVAAGAEKWFDVDINEKYDTIEELIEGYNTTSPARDNFVRMTIAGREYQKTNGYIGYDLFLAKVAPRTVNIEAVDANPSTLVKYSETEHLEKFVPQEVQGFADDATDPAVGSDFDADLSGAPDFEL